MTATDQTRATGGLPGLLEDIRRLVSCESPSSDLAAVAASADAVDALGAERLGVHAERIVLDGHTHLRWRLGEGPTRVLLLGHHDTVWPIGSLATHPCAVRDGRLTGPGCVDMKAGLAMAFRAVADVADPAGVAILVTGDEELGSPSSRALIEAEARRAQAVLVLEAAGPGGALKVERKGASIYELVIEGRAAHAGLDPGSGVNAVVELAHQVLATTELARPALGTTVTPTLSAAGTTVNTVPARASVSIDVRCTTTAEQRRVDDALRAAVPALPGAGLELRGGPNRPPLDRRASAALFDRAAVLADGLGLPPVEGVAVGGASDGNFTAGVGTPTLDGLGAVGGGAHADDEHVLVDALPGRTALITALVTDLLERPGGGPHHGDR